MFQTEQLEKSTIALKYHQIDARNELLVRFCIRYSGVTFFLTLVHPKHLWEKNKSFFFPSMIYRRALSLNLLVTLRFES